MTGNGNLAPGEDHAPPDISRVTIADRRVSAALRAIREELGITGDTVAARLGWSSSKVSRYELGMSRLRVGAVREAVDYYAARGLEPQRAAALMTLVTQIARSVRPPDERLAGADIACMVREWSPLTVPKLLQVPAYTRAVLASRQKVLLAPPSEINGMVQATALWQERLTDDPPLRLRAVLDESVLYRLAGDAVTMQRQLRHLDRIAREAGTDIRIRVLPMDRGAPAGISPFAYLEYPEEHGVAGSAAILVDDLDGPRVPVLAERDTWRRLLIFEQLWEAAEEPGPLIKRALNEAWPETS